MDKISRIPGIGTSNLKKNVKKGKMMISRAWETGLLFDHFTNNSWIFETKAVEDLFRQLAQKTAKSSISTPRTSIGDRLLNHIFTAFKSSVSSKTRSRPMSRLLHS